MEIIRPNLKFSEIMQKHILNNKTKLHQNVPCGISTNKDRVQDGGLLVDAKFFHCVLGCE